MTSPQQHSIVQRLLAVLATLSIAAVGLGGTQAAHADTNPAPGTPATVSADGLPTWQINGVAWSEVIVGTTVYVTGSFTKARPPGKPVGDPSEVNAQNIFAFDVTTGNRVASFSHSLNAQGLTIAASPDGSKIVVGGDFTTVDGLARSHIAAFDVATGALNTSFNALIGGQVRALALTNTTVYAGGAFMVAGGGFTRVRLASFSLATGAMSSWAPTAESNSVWAMVLVQGGSRLIVGGAFTTLNGIAAYGMGALDPQTGATLTWQANQVIRDAGTYGAITSLRTDGTQVFGSGYAFGTGSTFEGTFAADPATGAINWLNDCHGDTYDIVPVGQVLYSVSHAHDCSAIGAYPDTNPRTWRHAIASTTYPVGTNTGPDTYGWNYAGQPAAALLQWYPLLPPGTYTGQSQAAWSGTGNADYLVLGGEFPSVNGAAQQGLTRFATASKAPNKVGPLTGTTSAVTATTSLAGTARVVWGAMWDQDNANLTYDVQRDGAQFVYTVKANSTFWTLPSMSFLDSGLAPGSTHTYRVRVTDPRGNIRWSDTSAPVTVSSTALGAYASDVVGDQASSYWRLGEASGTAVRDSIGLFDATAGSGVTRNQAGALAGDNDTASRFGGSSTGSAGTNATTAGPQAFSLESWFKTTSVNGGEIVGLGSSKTGNSSTNDRLLYLDNSGHAFFGVNPGAVKTISSSGRYNDGAWHHVVGSLSPAGMVLYVDGVQVAQDASTTAAQVRSGYWRIGGDNLGGWPSKPKSGYLAGTIDEVALYPAALTLTQVREHYTDSGRSLAPLPPTAAFTSTVTNLAATVDGSTSSSVDGSISAWEWTFGDGGTGTGETTTHTYGAAGTFTVTLKVTATTGGTATTTHQVTTTAPPPNQLPTAAFASTSDFLIASFDGSGSSDPDGTVQSYAWDFGDGGSGDTATPTHTYAGAGTYLVALTVTDDRGGAATISHDVTVRANAAPTAAFTSSSTNLIATFDGTGSSDVDGTIAAYAWDFGDGGTATGVAPTHTFAAPGAYSVSLTVTDNSAATGAVTQTVNVTGPVTLAADDFARTVTNGWGTAAVGGAWTTSSLATNFAVANGVGNIFVKSAGVGPSNYLNGVASSDTDISVVTSVDQQATGTYGMYVYVVGRRVVGSGDYRALVRLAADGSVRLSLARTDAAGASTLLGTEVVVPNLSYTPGTKLAVRLRVDGTGPTNIAAKVWRQDGTEPGWQRQTTDATAALQTTGGIGLMAYLSNNATIFPVTASFQALRAYRASTLP